MKYIMFLGYPRSGSTISGIILDMHPDIKINSQFDVLKYYKKNNANKNQIIKATYKNNSAGKSDKAIGVKSGHKTLKTLFKFGSNDLLWNFENTIDMPIKYLQVIRNPFDMIGRWAHNQMNYKKKYNNVEEIINNKIKQFDRLNSQIEQIEKYRKVHKLYLEHLIKQPKKAIGRLFDFLEIDISNTLRKNIANMIYKEPKKSRNLINWNKEQTKELEIIINKYNFLKGYKWNS